MREIKFKAWSHKFKEMFHGRDVDLWGQPKMGRVRTASGRIDVEAELLQFTGVIDSNGKEIYEGDLHMTEPVDVDGEMKSSYLPVVYDNGAYWLDESFNKDGSFLTLLCQYDEPLNIQGNIYENPNAPYHKQRPSSM